MKTKMTRTRKFNREIGKDEAKDDGLRPGVATGQEKK